MSKFLRSAGILIDVNREQDGWLTGVEALRQHDAVVFPHLFTWVDHSFCGITSGFNPLSAATATEDGLPQAMCMSRAAGPPAVVDEGRDRGSGSTCPGARSACC